KRASSGARYSARSCWPPASPIIASRRTLSGSSTSCVTSQRAFSRTHRTQARRQSARHDPRTGTPTAATGTARNSVGLLTAAATWWPPSLAEVSMSDDVDTEPEQPPRRSPAALTALYRALSKVTAQCDLIRKAETERDSSALERAANEAVYRWLCARATLQR